MNELLKLEFGAGIVLGAFFGLIVTVLFQPPIERGKRILRDAISARRTRAKTSQRALDLESIDLYQIKSWSENHPLDPRRHRIEIDPTPRNPQEWFPHDIYHAAVMDKRGDVEGDVSEISHVRMDFGETGEESKAFVVRVRPSRYPDSLVISGLLGASDELWQPVENRITDTGILAALRVAPPQSFFVMLTLSTSNEVVALRRSAATASAAGMWALGVTETMKPIPDRPGEVPEDFFDLARRAAKEELGLRPDEYGPVWFTWYGFGRHHGQFAVAHIRTQLRATDVTARIARAEGRYEADDVKWLTLRGDEHRRLANTDQSGNRWLPLTPVAAQGLLDVHHCLTQEPHRR